MGQLVSTLNKGYYPEKRTMRAINRAGALERGDVVAIDWQGDDGDVSTTADLGEDDAVNANVVAVAAQEVSTWGTIAVALEDVADDAQGHFMISGIAEAYIIMASGSLSVGDPLVAIAASQDFDGVTAAGEHVYAIALEAATTPTTHTRVKVWLRGDNPFYTA